MPLAAPIIGLAGPGVKGACGVAARAKAAKLMGLWSCQGRSPDGVRWQEDGTSGRSGSIRHDRPGHRRSRCVLSLPRSRSRAPSLSPLGVFAPGHLGELTQFLPFELAGDVLTQTKTVHRRLRDLPSPCRSRRPARRRRRHHRHRPATPDATAPTTARNNIRCNTARSARSFSSSAACPAFSARSRAFSGRSSPASCANSRFASSAAARDDCSWLLPVAAIFHRLR